MSRKMRHHTERVNYQQWTNFFPPFFYHFALSSFFNVTFHLAVIKRVMYTGMVSVCVSVCFFSLFFTFSTTKTGKYKQTARQPSLLPRHSLSESIKLKGKRKFYKPFMYCSLPIHMTNPRLPPFRIYTLYSLFTLSFTSSLPSFTLS